MFAVALPRFLSRLIYGDRPSMEPPFVGGLFECDGGKEIRNLIFAVLRSVTHTTISLRQASNGSFGLFEPDHVWLAVAHCAEAFFD